MNLDDVIRYYENRAKRQGFKYTGHVAVAKALGITKGAVWQWSRAGVIPLDRQRHIQIDSKGKFKVGNGDASKPR